MRATLRIVLLLILLPFGCSAEQSDSPAAAPQAEQSSPATSPEADIQVAEAKPALPAAAPTSVEPRYTTLKSPQPVATAGKIEVVEIFLYTCPHCYQFEPKLNAWRSKLPADVSFTRLPGSYNEVMAKTYYTAELMGEEVLAKMHPLVFDAIHKQRRPLNNLDDVAKLFAENGIKEEEFRGMYESFAVDGKFRKGQQLEVGYEIKGVPAMAVNGKYAVFISRTQGPDQLLKVVDELVAKERKAGATN
jgi:thiol:disulfide interchange protein DsbA